MSDGQNIECTSCHDIVNVVTGNTISIPYVCNTCTNETGTCDCETCVPEFVEPAPETSILPDTCDTATVENTTLLIEDLQLQLDEMSEKFIESQNDLHNAKQARAVEEMANIDLRSDNAFLRNQLDDLSQNYAKVRIDLKAALGIAQRLA